MEETGSGILDLIANGNAHRLSSLFSNIQGKAQAIALLKSMIRILEPVLDVEEGEEVPGVKRPRTADAAARPDEVLPGEMYDSCILNDEVDTLPLTCVLMIPNDVSVVANIIGKQGVNIQEIKRRSGAKVQVDRVERPDRHVFIMGNVHTVFLGLQLVLEKVNERAKVPMNDIKILIPDDLVSHIIGKSGSVVKRLQLESGAQLQIQAAPTPMAVGRLVTAIGTTVQMFKVVYLVLRSLAEDKLLPESWKGQMPQPTPGPAPMQMQGMGIMQQPHSQYDPYAHMSGKAPPMIQGQMSSYSQPPTSMNPPGPPQAQPMSAPYGAPSFNPTVGAPPNAPYSAPSTSQPYTSVPAAQPRNPGMGGTKQEVFVPDMSVSYIIGKRGSLIAELQANSNANVEITKMCDPGSSERRVIITGQTSNVHQALLLLDDRVKEWQSRNGFDVIGIPNLSSALNATGAGSSSYGGEYRAPSNTQGQYGTPASAPYQRGGASSQYQSSQGSTQFQYGQPSTQPQYQQGSSQYQPYSSGGAANGGQYYSR